MRSTLRCLHAEARAHAHADRLRRRRGARVHRLSPLARAIAALAVLAGAQTLPAQTPPVLPSGAQVQAGQASITTQGAQMTVRNTPGTVLNWQSFNIGAGAGVYFDQAHAASRVLNRVVGSDPSNIFGSLASNGQVWLLNPHGVLFGAGARVDVAGLVAGTLRLNDNDFLAGRYRFGAADGDQVAAVRNQGTLRTVHGGHIVLLGQRVENAGEASAPGGQVALVAGRSVELVDTGLPNLVVRVPEGTGQVLNTGRLAADGGRVDVYGAIVNQDGVVRADTLVADAQGRIVLRAADTLTLGERSVTAATAPAAARSGAEAAGEARGGSIDLLGGQVAMVGGAIVDVSGAAGGGTIRLGGGLQGRDASVPNSRAVYLGPLAELRANATGTRGDGGRIIVWSDEATRAYGRFSARGARLGGDGGFVETSGGWLDARPAAMDLSAASGRAGNWLLDPNNITITSATTAIDTNISAGPVFTSTANSSILTTATLAAALNAGTSVSVITANAGLNSQVGDISMNDAALNVAPPSAVTLTLQAARDISIRRSTIGSSEGASPLSLVLTSGTAGEGIIRITGSTITTRGGDVTLGGAAARELTLPGGGTVTRNVAVGRFVGEEGPGSGGIDINSSTIGLGAGTFSAAGYAPVGGVGLRIGDGDSTTSIVARGIELFGASLVDPDVTGTGVLLDAATTLAATQSLRIEGSGNAGARFELGSRLAVQAPPGAAGTLSIVGHGGNQPGVELRNVDLVVNNAALDVQARSVDSAGLVVLGAVGQPRPRLDLGGATGAVFEVPSSAQSEDFGFTSILLDNVDLALPAAGSTTFSGNLGVTLNQVAATAGSGALSLRGARVELLDSTFTGNGLAVDFATTGALPRGVLLEGTSITTGGGDVRFGALQSVTSPRLGTTTAPGFWVELADPQFEAPALEISFSSINAGTGTIRGGGANLAACCGVDLTFSTLTAREIHLAGRSDAEIGIAVDRSTLTATRQLTLEGLSAGASRLTSTGLHIFEGSTLQLLDPTATAGSQMRLRGENAFGGDGLVIEGGVAATESAPTRVVVGGASLLAEGVAVGDAALLLLGDTVAPGGLSIDARGASAVTLRGTSSGAALALQLRNVQLQLPATGSTTLTGNLGVNLDQVVATAGSGTLSFTGSQVELFDSTFTGAGLAVDFATTGALPRGVLLEGTRITTGGGDVRFGALQNVTSPRLGTTPAAGPWVEQADPQFAVPALEIVASSIDAGSGTIRGGGANRAACCGVALTSSSLNARQIHLAGRSELQYGVLVDGSTLAATEQLTIDGRSAGADPVASVGLLIGEGTTLQVSNPGAAAGAQLALRGENRFGGRGLVMRGGTAASEEGAPTRVVAGAASLLVEGIALGNVGLQMSGDGFGAGGLTLDARGASAVTLRGSSNGGASQEFEADSVRPLGVTTLGPPSGASPSAALDMRFAELLGPTVAGSPTRLEAAGALTLANSQLSTIGALTLEASGAGINGSLLSVVASTLAAGGALTIDGRASSGGIGVSLLGGNALSGASVAVTGAGSGASGVSFNAAAGASILTATLGDLTVDGGAASGLLPSVSLAGDWLLRAAQALTLQTRNAVPMAAGGSAGLAPRFSAGQAFVLANESPTGLVVGPGQAIDSGALSSALAGMPAAATSTLRAAVGTGSLVLRGAIDVPSRFALLADRISLEAGGSLASSAGGDALVIGGASATTLARFGNTSSAGAAALTAPNGRWVLLADDPRQVALGGLAADFTAYGLAARPWARDAAGNFITPVAGDVLGFGVSTSQLTGSAGDPATSVTNQVLEATHKAVQVPIEMSTPTTSRLFDAAVATEGGDGMSRRALDWSLLAREEATTLLAARARYKQKIFARGVYRLQEDPRLADAPTCATESDLDTGRCIITEQLKQQIEAARAARAAAAAAAAGPPSAQRRILRAELPGIERKLALLIGVNRYADSRVPELTGAVPDVRAMQALLEGRLGYETTVLENPTREAIVRGFNRLALQAQANDSVIIYYAGHGVVVPVGGVDTGFWLPADVDAELPNTWLANADIARMVAAVGAKQLMLVSDSCYSGTLVGKERVQVAGDASNADELLRRRAAVVMSSGGDEPVADSGRDGHSIFAWHLMRALEGLDRWQVGGNLYERVRAAVVREFPQTPQYGASRTAGHQGGTDYLFERRALETRGP